MVAPPWTLVTLIPSPRVEQTSGLPLKLVYAEELGEGKHPTHMSSQSHRLLPSLTYTYLSLCSQTSLLKPTALPAQLSPCHPPYSYSPST